MKLTETLIELVDVAKYLSSLKTWYPSRSPRPGMGTVNRWHTQGVRGHKLEIKQIAGRNYTSIEALDRFFTLCAGQAAPQPVAPAKRGMSKAEARRLIP